MPRPSLRRATAAPSRSRNIGTIAIGTTLLALTLGGCGGEAGSATPHDARAFFKGRTLTYIVATGPGGGYDTYGRLVSRYLGKYLGLKTVVVRNVPGGGHIKGANEIYAARPDGLTQGSFNTGLIYAQLLRREGMRADLKRMSWIGKAGLDARLLTVSRKSGFRSLDDIRKAGRPLLLGTSGLGNESYYDTMLLAHALDLRVTLVFGLSTREAQLSMMRGEIDGEVGSASSSRSFVTNGHGYSVVRVGRAEGVDQGIPDAAAMASTAEARTVIDFVGSLAELLRWTAGPPGIPEDRLAVLREAYTLALRDPALLAEARRLDIPIVPMDGATLAREVERALAQPPQTVALIASIVGVDLGS